MAQSGLYFVGKQPATLRPYRHRGQCASVGEIDRDVLLDRRLIEAKRPLGLPSARLKTSTSQLASGPVPSWAGCVPGRFTLPTSARFDAIAGGHREGSFHMHPSDSKRALDI